MKLKIRVNQAQNQYGLEQCLNVQFDLKDHRQSPHKTKGILTKVFYISDPNLVILAWTVDELSHGQAHDWRTHRHTHTQATTIPEGQNWPRVKSNGGILFAHVGSLLPIAAFRINCWCREISRRKCYQQQRRFMECIKIRPIGKDTLTLISFSVGYVLINLALHNKSSQRLPNTPICQHQWMPC